MAAPGCGRGGVSASPQRTCAELRYITGLSERAAAAAEPGGGGAGRRGRGRGWPAGRSRESFRPGPRVLPQLPGTCRFRGRLPARSEPLQHPGGEQRPGAAAMELSRDGAGTAKPPKHLWRQPRTHIRIQQRFHSDTERYLHPRAPDGAPRPGLRQPRMSWPCSLQRR